MRSWLGWCFVLALGCAHEGQAPPAWDASARESLRIPGGKRCLSVLDRLGVKYKKLSPRGKVRTPVEIRSADLLLLLAGTDLTHTRRRRWYERVA